MEHETPYRTLATINQVNMLIRKVEYLLDTSTDEDCFLNIPQLLELSRMASEICAYVVKENDISDIETILPSAPLYRLMLNCKLSGEMRQSISDYCRQIAELKEWSNEQSESIKLENIELPPRLCTDKAKRNFRIALDNKLIERTQEGYKWIFKNGHKASLAEFLEITYCDSATDYIKHDVCKELENVFGVKRLDRALQQTVSGETPAVQEWKAYLKNLFL